MNSPAFMNQKKSYKLTNEERSEVRLHYHRNEITIIGIGDFGEAVLYKIIKYHKLESYNNFRSNYVHISQPDYENMLGWLKITDGLILDTDLVLIVGNINDPICGEVSKKLTKTFKGKQIVGFFAGVEENLSMPGFDGIVQLTEDVEDAYLAVRLLPDIRTRCTMIGVDWNDISQILKLGEGFFKLLNVDFEKNKLENFPDSGEKFHIAQNTGGCGIFVVYGDGDLSMTWVDTIATAMSQKNDGVYVFTPVVRSSKYDKVKTVLLYSEKLVKHL